MKKMSKLLQFLLVFSMVLSLAGVALAQTAPCPPCPGQTPCVNGVAKKADNFIFIYDQSGSMAKPYANTGKSKASLAKQLMLDINKCIPEAGYNAGLVTFAGYDVIAPMAPYKRAAFGQAISSLNENVTPVLGFLGNPTPLGEGFQDLQGVLKTLKGKTALVLFSDMGQNLNVEPQSVLGKLLKKYDACLHLVSFAQSNSEKSYEKALSKFAPCQAVADYSALGTEKAKCDFIKKALWDDCAAPAPAPKAEPKCKDVPADAELDKDGCPIPETMDIKVLFDFDKYNIKPKYVDEVRKFADFAKQYPDKNITIEGHTDSKGSDAYNEKLSLRRANAVKDMLVKKFGMKASRLKAVGYGESKPVATNDTEEGRAKNRRTVGVIEGVYKKKK